MRLAHAFALLLALGAIVISPAGAMASWMLTVSDGTPSGTVTFTGGSSPPGSSEFQLEGPAVSPDSKYSFIVALTDGQTVTQSSLSEIAISIANLTGGNLPITTTLSENDFTLPGTPGSQVFVQSNISATSPTGGSGTFQTLFDGIPMPLQSFVVPDTGSGETAIFTRGASFSLQQTTKLTLGGGQQLQVTGTDTVTPVPQPSTIALALCAAVCCVPLARRARLGF